MSKNRIEEQAPPVRTGQAPEKQTHTVPEVAVILGISRTLAYELANDNQLPGVRRLGHRFIVSKAELAAFLGVGEAA